MADTNDKASLSRHNLISEQTAGFMTLLFDGQTRNSTTHRTRLRQSILEAIRGCYSDPELAPADIAKLVGISKRSLHMTFAEAGTTFGKALSRLRMGQARKLLADKDFAPLSIAEIA